jgi:acyl-coenzyme A synthetase/AMP-(fatty) acid ligase
VLLVSHTFQQRALPYPLACCSCHALHPQVDLSHLRLLSCGGSPQSPTIIARAIAALGCEFFVSYGMTECCGKISMSILPTNWQQQLQQAAAAGGDDESAAAAEVYGSLLGRVCTTGRPFMLMEVSHTAG